MTGWIVKKLGWDPIRVARIRDNIVVMMIAAGIAESIYVNINVAGLITNRAKDRKHNADLICKKFDHLNTYLTNFFKVTPKQNKASAAIINKVLNGKHTVIVHPGKGKKDIVVHFTNKQVTFLKLYVSSIVTIEQIPQIANLHPYKQGNISCTAFVARAGH